MQEYHLPEHLTIPAVISLLLLTIIFLIRNKLIISKKNKQFWLGLIIFLSSYFIVLAGCIYTDFSLKMDLNSFDLNSDGFFNGLEITTAQQAALRKVSSDTARILAPITAIFFSGFMTIVVLLIGKLIRKFTS